MKKGELVELLARFGDDETVLIRLDRPTLTIDPGGNPILPGRDLLKIEAVGQRGRYPSDITIEATQP